jgi:hypothetical protein
MVLRTELRTTTGRLALSDFMALHADDMYNDIGRRSPAGNAVRPGGVDLFAISLGSI